MPGWHRRPSEPHKLRSATRGSSRSYTRSSFQATPQHRRSRAFKDEADNVSCTVVLGLITQYLVLLSPMPPSGGTGSVIELIPRLQRVLTAPPPATCQYFGTGVSRAASGSTGPVPSTSDVEAGNFFLGAVSLLHWGQRRNTKAEYKAVTSACSSVCIDSPRPASSRILACAVMLPQSC